jgi:hypothetical protein
MAQEDQNKTQADKRLEFFMDKVLPVAGLSVIFGICANGLRKENAAKAAPHETVVEVFEGAACKDAREEKTYSQNGVTVTWSLPAGCKPK